VDAAEHAVDIQRKLAANHKGVSSYQGELAQGLFAQGEVYLSIAAITKAKPAYEEAAEIKSIGAITKAKAAYKEAVGIQEKLVRDIRDVPHYQRDLARSHNGLGLVFAMSQKEEDKAADAYKKALGLWEKLLKDHSNELDYTLGLSGTCLDLGDLARAGNNPKVALDWYTRAVKSLDAKDKKMLENPSLKNSLLNAHGKRAEFLTQLGRAAESLSDWERALQLAPEKLKRAIRFPRAEALARAGKYKDATKEAGDLTEQDLKGGELYRLARVYSVSAAVVAGDGQLKAPDRQKLVEQYAGNGEGLLAEARNAGFFKSPANLEKLKTDPDLQALRTRPAFAKLLSELESK
jgi:tetratricopeptide (TPR) repeat protein